MNTRTLYLIHYPGRMHVSAACESVFQTARELHRDGVPYMIERANRATGQRQTIKNTEPATAYGYERKRRPC